jgi:hypothetical protein
VTSDACKPCNYYGHVLLKNYAKFSGTSEGPLATLEKLQSMPMHLFIVYRTS